MHTPSINITAAKSSLSLTHTHAQRPYLISWSVSGLLSVCSFILICAEMLLQHISEVFLLLGPFFRPQYPLKVTLSLISFYQIVNYLNVGACAPLEPREIAPWFERLIALIFVLQVNVAPRLLTGQTGTVSPHFDWKFEKVKEPLCLRVCLPSKAAGQGQGSPALSADLWMGQ